jgi:type II secretory pathway predicted ATPase ExeA
VEHLHHFNLSGDPFRNEPLLRLFFGGGSHKDALRRLERAVRQGRGLSVLVGPTGSGKTMVVRQLLDNLEDEAFDASMMVVLDGAADAAWMLRRFAKQLGVDEPATEREGLLGQIFEQLAIVREDGRQAVLIIDDAQSLIESGALPEICGLLKLEYEERRLLSLVLAGPLLLDDIFRSHPTLAHRVDVRVALDPFSPDAAAAYITHRIEQVNGKIDILDHDCIAALHELAGGYPGRMNTLADNALFEAFLCGRKQMTRLDVERAHRDLAWSTAPSQSTPTQAPEPTPIAVAEAAPANADPRLQETLDQLDSELASVFDASEAPSDGPPKDEDPEPADLLIELVED